MWRRLRSMLPHAAILICNMYIVFFLIDRVNPAMNFIDNGLTKGLLLILCVAGGFNAWRMAHSPARRPMPARGDSRRDYNAAPRRAYPDGYRYGDDRYAPRRYDGERYASRRYGDDRYAPRRYDDRYARRRYDGYGARDSGSYGRYVREDDRRY